MYLDTALQSTGSHSTNTSTLSKSELIVAVAAKLEHHGLKGLGGIDKIEHLPLDDVAQLPIANTVFAVIAEELRQLGVLVDDTVGSVMEALTPFRGNSEKAAYWAHEIGCHCRGEFISSSIASQRLLNMIGRVV